MRIYRLALLAYPAAYRRERGAELLGALAEAGPVRAGELVSLVVGGIRERGRAATGGSPRAAWQDGLRLSALVLLVLSASPALFTIALDLWRTPQDQMMATSAVVRFAVAGLLPVAAAFFVTRGRALPAIGLVVVAAGLLLAREVPFTAAFSQSWPADEPWAANLFLLCDAAFVAAPAVLLWPGRDRRGPVRTPLWLVLPFALAALSLLGGYYQTTLIFWPAGVLALAWFLLSPADLRLGAAAFGLLAPAAVLVLPSALVSTQFEYAVAVTAGAIAVACASLAGTLAAGRDSAPSR